MFLAATRHCTDTVNSYASFYKGRKSDKELLYMAMIDIALRYERESKRNDTKPFCDILKKLTVEMEDVLEPPVEPKS